MNVCCCVVVVFLCCCFLHIYHTPPPPSVYGSVAFTIDHVSVSVSLSLSVSVSQKKKKKKKEKKKKRSEAYGSVEVCFIRIQQTRSSTFQLRQLHIQSLFVPCTAEAEWFCIME